MGGQLIMLVPLSRKRHTFTTYSYKKSNMSVKQLFLFLTLFLCLSHLSLAQEEISLVSWNIRDFGKTKSAEEIERMAEILRDYDIIAIQEVVAGYGGSQAVARLADELNRKGSNWEYAISNPTSSPAYKTEKYAFLWKTSQVKVVEKATLLGVLKDCVYREPYQIKFKVKGNLVTILNYHARKQKELPEEEVSCISDYIMHHQTEHIILAGDFNLSMDHQAFEKLKEAQYDTCATAGSTSLKRTCKDNEYLHQPMDHIIYDSQKNVVTDCGAIDFVQECDRLESSRMLSDHLPVYMRFIWK
ncbi:endonuclease/exonuclease/phosphatase family protein [Nonlabens sp.]|uniref:endonuclease/exonuclease/phosphatase family protein n=1 Tax=Nonlabens sp. TaxID=1888209 RepID=UPI00262E1B9F|nr:endonuclease/exonuclease/phosphatase family protein [Nonlabens sp.]